MKSEHITVVKHSWTNDEQNLALIIINSNKKKSQQPKIEKNTLKMKEKNI